MNVGGRGVVVENSIAEGHRMLDRLEEYMQERADPRHQASLSQAIDDARQRLADLSSHD